MPASVFDCLRLGVVFVALVLGSSAAFPSELNTFILVAPKISDKEIAGLTKEDARAKVLLTFPDGNAALVNTTLSLDAVKKATGAEAKLPAPLQVELFDASGPDCGDPEELPEQRTPSNVCRVVGVAPSPVARASTVWVVDSGIDPSVVTKKLINVGARIDCLSGACDEVGSSLTDELGHGTMVAGVIGAQPASIGGTNKGLFGVAPGATINVVKAFGRRPTANFWEAPALALDYVRRHGTAGDIVNISWGGRWLSLARSSDYAGLKLVDNLVHDMADRGMKIVLAAGNIDSLANAPFWAGFVSPANAAGYRGATGGMIYAVGAVQSSIPVGSTRWVDDFWPYSAYGFETNSFYAEPGVGVTSLWRAKGSPKINTCSGTSFAAPAFAGLLVRNDEIKRAEVNGFPVVGVSPFAFSNDNGGRPCP